VSWQAGMGERYKDLALRYLQDEALFETRRFRPIS
jgi:hypothetical protein